MPNTSQIIHRTIFALVLMLQASNASILTNGGLEMLSGDIGTVKTVLPGASYA